MVMPMKPKSNKKERWRHISTRTSVSDKERKQNKKKNYKTSQWLRQFATSVAYHSQFQLFEYRIFISRITFWVICFYFEASSHKASNIFASIIELEQSDSFRTRQSAISVAYHSQFWKFWKSSLFFRMRFMLSHQVMSSIMSVLKIESYNGG
jgi:hypothetical protein